MKIIALTFALSLSGLFGFSQGNSIKGIVTGEDKLPIPHATFFLKHSADSSLYKGEVSNSSGEFEFQNIKKGTYFLQIQFLGYTPYFKTINFSNDSTAILNLGVVELVPLANELKAAIVLAEKPFIEKHADKTVINIENSIVQAGSSLMDILEKLPGVIVDQDGNIRLRGKQGVIVMLDGKRTSLSGQDLANMLRGMPSSNVLNIELITNPSAKFDASGNAGIINIITKKNRQDGFNGSVNLSYGQGVYAKYNGSFNLNYKKNKFNLFLSYSYSNRQGFNHLNIDRKFFSADTLLTTFLTNNYIIYPFSTHIPRMGIDYNFSQKTTLSFLGSVFCNQLTPITTSHSDILDQNQEKISAYDFYQDSKEKVFMYDFSLQFNHKIDSLGQEIIFSLDHVNYEDKTNQNFSNIYYDGNNNIDSVYYLTGKQDGSLALYSFKADYTKPFKKDITFDAGVKSSLVNSDRDMQFYQILNESEVFDSLRSSHFLYSENLNAAYVNFNKKFKKLTLQLGLRMEHTYAEGEQVLNGVTFTRNYAQIFPTAYLNYEAGENHNFNLNVGRRIDRPGYEQLNPFRNMIDATTYGEGNPYLLPQLTYNTEFSYGFKNTFFLTLNYSYTYDNITDVLIQDAATRTTIQTIVNLNELNFYSADLAFSKRLTKWWKTNSHIMSYFGKYSGTVNDYTINQGKPSFYLSTNNSFTIVEGFSAECNFNLSYRNLYGVTLMKTTHNLSLGLQKSILKKKGNITINYTDVLWKAYPRGITDFGNVIEEWAAKRDTRVLNISFSYKFGKTAGGRMRRTTGADDEKSRMN